MEHTLLAELEARLTDLIEPEARALGFDLVRVKLFGAAGDRTLQVMAERPDTRQLNIDDCAALSRRISDVMDEKDPIEEAYRLEVSSPGIDRPLTRLKDFDDWKSHEARIVLAEPIDGRKQLTGDLHGLDHGGSVMIIVRGHGLMSVSLEKIASAKLLFTDRLLAATAPLDTSGVEEEEIIADATEEDADTNRLEGQD